jgi:hypothetical protein
MWYALAASVALATTSARAAGMTEEVERASADFLGRPYERGHLGEGTETRDPDGRHSGRFDSHPFSDTTRFDCTTFVEQVVALSAARTRGEGDAGALARLRRIRYRDGAVSYASRNHFAEADWLPNNAAAGYLRDITRTAASDAAARDPGAGIEALTAYKTISKRAWYEAKTEDELEGPLAENLAPAEKRALLREWRALGASAPDQRVSLPYIPLSQLDALLSLDPTLVPSGAVLSVVRAEDARMPVMVTHQGFLIRRDGRAYLRHAKVGDRVVDSEIRSYFERQARQPWPVLGVNIALPLAP